MPTDPLFTIFVFSFNRGQFLEHCIRTIELCAPGHRPIIIDDGSFDRRTCEVLAELGSRYEVMSRASPRLREWKTGGLSANMQIAFEIAQERGVGRVLFAQDDTQFVRRLDPSDLRRIDAFFASNPDAMELQPCFIRRSNQERMRAEAAVDRSGSALIRKRESQTGKANFSAVGIFDVPRFFDLFGTLAAGEGTNSALARARGLQLGRYLYPFMSWLPYPSSYRGKKRSLGHAVLEALGGAGFHPIELMDEDAAARFLDRESSILPIAEHFLRSPTAPRHDVWSTGGGEYNVLSRGGWRAAGLKAGVATGRRVKWMSRAVQRAWGE